MNTYWDETNCFNCNKLGEIFCDKCKMPLCKENICFTKHTENCKNYTLRTLADYFNEQKPIRDQKLDEIEIIKKDAYKLLFNEYKSLKNNQIYLAEYKKDLERNYIDSIKFLKHKENFINHRLHLRKMEILSFIQETKLLGKTISNAKIWNDYINERFAILNEKFNQMKNNFVDLDNEKNLLSVNINSNFQEKEFHDYIVHQHKINDDKKQEKEKAIEKEKEIEKSKIKSELLFLKISLELILEKINYREMGNLFKDLSYKFNNSKSNLVSYFNLVREILTKNHKNQNSIKIIYNFKNKIREFPRLFLFYLFEKQKDIFLHLIKFGDDKLLELKIYNTIMKNNSTVAIGETSDSIIITGGYFNCQFLDFGIRIFKNLNECVLKVITKMNYKRCRHRLITMHNLQYCLGGFNEDKALAECEFFDELTKKWSFFPSLPMPACDLTVTGFENRYIYTFSSFKDSSIYKIDSFDLKKTWLEIQHSNFKLINYGICITKGNNHILIFGGKSNKDTIYELDLNTFQYFKRKETFSISKDEEYWFSCIKFKNETYYAIFVKSKSIIQYSVQNDKFHILNLYF